MFLLAGHDWVDGLDLKRHLKFKQCVRCGERIVNKKELVSKAKKMRKNGQKVKFY